MTRPALRTARLLALALAAFSLTACIERKQTAFINPDGSGKIIIDTIVALPDAAGAGGPKPDPATAGKQVASGLINQARGVDAWKDISIDVTADGRPHVLATAYFPDISKLKLDVALPIIWKQNADGTYTLLVQKDKSADAAVAKPNLTEAQVTEQVAKAKADYKQNQPMAQMILSTLKIETSYTLPGPVTDSNIFTKSADNTVTLSIDGKKMLSAMDKMMDDDKALADSIRAGKDTSDNDDAMIENMFGKKGPISATVAAGAKPLFDYKAEMQAAKTAEPDMMKKLNLDTPPAMPGGMTPPPAPPQ